jgi:hypothetical protein
MEGKEETERVGGEAGFGDDESRSRERRAGKATVSGACGRPWGTAGELVK